MKKESLQTIDATPETDAAFSTLTKMPTLVKQLRVVGLDDFLRMELPIRDTMIGPWLMTQSLNMIYGWRGIGKTLVSLGIAYAVASGGNFLGWQAKRPWRVLLVDGEMPAPALQERLAAIRASNKLKPEPGFLSILTPDLQTGAMPDLSTYPGQDAITRIAEQVNADLIVIDNLSCLVRGEGRENDAESWISVSEWALLQRQAGRSILFIHHSGKNGQQRGTSKREDLLDVVLSLRKPPDYDPVKGACFEVHFEKARHLAGSDLNPFEARLTKDSKGDSIWDLINVTTSTVARVANLANNGLSQSKIVNELNIDKSNVSRAWRKAEELGKIKNKSTIKPESVSKRARSKRQLQN